MGTRDRERDRATRRLMWKKKWGDKRLTQRDQAMRRLMWMKNLGDKRLRNEENDVEEKVGSQEIERD